MIVSRVSEESVARSTATARRQSGGVPSRDCYDRIDTTTITQSDAGGPINAAARRTTWHPRHVRARTPYVSDASLFTRRAYPAARPKPTSSPLSLSPSSRCAEQSHLGSCPTPLAPAERAGTLVPTHRIGNRPRHAGASANTHERLTRPWGRRRRPSSAFPDRRGRCREPCPPGRPQCRAAEARTIRARLLRCAVHGARQACDAMPADAHRLVPDPCHSCRTLAVTTRTSAATSRLARTGTAMRGGHSRCSPRPHLGLGREDIPEEEDGREDDDDALDDVAHAVGHGVHAAERVVGELVVEVVQETHGDEGGVELLSAHLRSEESRAGPLERGSACSRVTLCCCTSLCKSCMRGSPATQRAVQTKKLKS